MARFTTRVQLHMAKNESEYEILHKEMEKEGFVRTIAADDGGEIFHLPMAEYNLVGEFTTDQVLEKAKKAAARTKKEHRILVTKSAGRLWHNLEEV